KHVLCEFCSMPFAYQLQRAAKVIDVGHRYFETNGGNSKDALQRANIKLRSKLDNAFDIVPCPACGWYQQNMVLKARKYRHLWMRAIAFSLILLDLPLAFYIGIENLVNGGTVPWLGIVAIFSPALMIAWLILAIRNVIVSGYDPNSQDVEKRLQLAKSRAIMLSKK
ncbi:MAG TPA: hypothetical protein VE988_01595, partial [Gemmataceae bacterium]|nr:hypothetical protein [Gemmataceae bacterium]